MPPIVSRGTPDDTVVGPVGASAWITKAEAAKMLGVDERTIERRARAGKLEAKARPGFPTLYRASQVRDLALGGSVEVRTPYLATIPDSGNGHGLTQRPPVDIAGLVEILQGIRAALVGSAPIGPTGPTDPPTGPTRPILTLSEAVDASGWSRTFLVRAIHEGRLPAVKDRGWKIRRVDLEAL